MTLIKRVLNWLAPESTESQEAEDENIAFDRAKVDEEFEATIRTLRKARKTAEAFIVAGELFVKDVQGGEKSYAKNTSRTKKSK